MADDTLELRRAWDIDRYTDGYTSTLWRYLGDAYASQPLLGAEYFCALPGNTLTTGTSWVFSGIAPGTSLPGFIAGEIDRVDSNLYRRPSLTVVAGGTGICRTSGRPGPMHMTTFTAPSGARVFNGSTFAYGCFLEGRCPSNWTVPAPSAQSRQAVGRMVANITEWVSRGAIQVPSDAAVAAVRAAVPKHHLESSNQP